jgi:hypothetical protein
MARLRSNVYEFSEQWHIKNVNPADVCDILADMRLLPEWWRGVYLEAKPIDWDTPRVGNRTQVMARGFLPMRHRCVLELSRWSPNLVEFRTYGDLEGVWTGVLSAQGADTRVDVEWRVIANKPIVRLLSPLLRPLFEMNHKWTNARAEVGMRNFVSRIPPTPHARTATRAAVSIAAFGMYMMALGIGFAVMPDPLIDLFALPHGGAWTRLLGGLVAILGSYYLVAARHDARPFFKATVAGRGVLVLFGLALVFRSAFPAQFLLVLVPDLLGALWTAWALREERHAKTQEVVGPPNSDTRLEPSTGVV